MAELSFERQIRISFKTEKVKSAKYAIKTHIIIQNVFVVTASITTLVVT